MDNGSPMRKGEYLLDEEIWIECGMYLSEYETTMPDILEDSEIADITDEIIVRIMK